MEFRDCDLHSEAQANVEFLSKWEWTQDESGSQKDLPGSLQWAVYPECRVLLEHGPDLSFDAVVNCSVKEQRSAQNIGAAGGQGCANGALNVPGAKAFGHGQSWRQDRVAKPVRDATGRNGSAKEESYKVIALALCP